MKDETYAFISDVKEKKVTARSARHTRTHCGKGGRVRLPSDNLSKKELKKMSGECKSYRLNEPMTYAEFRSMPEDIQITYIKLLREKYNVPDKNLAEMFGISKDSISRTFKKMGLQRNVHVSHPKWDKEGFYAWLHDMNKLPTTVPEEPTQEEKEAIFFGEEKDYVEDDLPFEEPDHPIRIDPIEKCIELKEENKALNTYIDELKKRIDELLHMNGELAAVHEKDKAEIKWKQNECDSLRMNARILEAQMEVVRMIFGGKNNG